MRIRDTWRIQPQDKASIRERTRLGTKFLRGCVNSTRKWKWRINKMVHDETSNNAMSREYSQCTISNLMCARYEDLRQHNTWSKLTLQHLLRSDHMTRLMNEQARRLLLALRDSCSSCITPRAWLSLLIETRQRLRIVHQKHKRGRHASKNEVSWMRRSWVLVRTILEHVCTCLRMSVGVTRGSVVKKAWHWRASGSAKA